MSKSNPQIVLDSFPLSKSFQLGDVKKNKLVPNAFGKSQNLFLKTWREQSVTNGDWGTTWNFVTPESLNVVSSHFLEIPLPVIGGGNYKPVPGLYIIDEIKLLSNGSEVYTLDYKMYMREFLSSLSNEEYAQFANTYLGGTTQSGAARTVSLPLMLPNSHYLRRHSKQNYGVFPHRLSARLEFQIKMGTAAEAALLGSESPAAIAGLANIVTREVKGDQARIVRRFADARGVYSVCVPRFQTIVEWKDLAANTRDSVKATLPTGSCYEFIVEAYPSAEALAATNRNTATTPTFYKIQADGEDIRVLDSSVRVGQELFSNGYRSNDSLNNCARICFADYCSQSDHCYQGSLHCQNISSIQTEVEFAENTRYRIVAKKYSKVRIGANGVIRSSLE